MRRRPTTLLLCGCAALALASGCDAPAPATPRPGSPDALAIALAAHAAHGPEIRRLQQRVAEARDPVPALDRLGWAFVALARSESDPGYYQLALRCAAAMAERGADGPEAWLLRGHALHGLHRFEEAERVARRLVAARSLPFDHGLLGDVLLDRGDIAAASAAYQRMADLRPDSHALVRAARVRFLTGDLPGAIRAMTSAARATSPRHAEGFAWTWSQLALYRLERGDLDAAHRISERALAVAPESAPALFARGRALLAQGRAAEALEPLRAAARRSPLPDRLWTLAEALQAAGLAGEEAEVRARLVASGAETDPRGLSVYLASHGLEPRRALELARRELASRRDVYTWDALAWAQAANGRHAEALASTRRALAAGTRDAALFLHAGVIAASAGRADLAARWLAEADALRHALLPSQRAALDARLQPSRATTASS